MPQFNHDDAAVFLLLAKMMDNEDITQVTRSSGAWRLIKNGTGCNTIVGESFHLCVALKKVLTDL